MKLIDAFWEKRNLGVKSCHELIIEKSDSLNSVKSQLLLLNSEYVVVKVPDGRIELSFLLTELGYSFIENLIHFTYNPKIHKSIIQRILEDINYVKMDEADIDYLFCEIRKNIFSTDRVFLDPYFSSEQASNRYIGWIKDELTKSCDIYKLVLQNKDVGFFTFKDLGEGRYFPFLIGIYSNFLNRALGRCLIYSIIQETIKRNGKIISTYSSSNNIRAVRCYSSLKFNISGMQYVYVKHNK
ncbi:MAG: hypothetical protein LBU10_04745 [Endomicrobium sp.]|jgi:hypothetical protein|nr:hypothetical protein [Endomicrobium sp.]